MFHSTRPPDENDLPEGEIAEIMSPTLIHTVLLMAKRCLFQKWLSSEPPDLPMLVSQLKSNLLLDKIHTERHRDKGTKGFLKKMEDLHYHSLF